MQSRGEQSAFTPIGRPRIWIQLREVQARRQAGQHDGMPYEIVEIEVGRLQFALSFDTVEKPEPTRNGKSRVVIRLLGVVILELIAEFFGIGLVELLRFLF